MKGGFVSCKRNKWLPENLKGEQYNYEEAEALNILGICKNGNGTDKYELNSSKNWYIISNQKDKKTLGEILEDLKNNNIKKIKTEKDAKDDNKFYKANKFFQSALRLREKKSEIWEKRQGTNLTEITKKHIEYINSLYDLIARISIDSDYIEARRNIMRQKITRKRSRSRSRRRSRSRSKSKSKSKSSRIK